MKLVRALIAAGAALAAAVTLQLATSSPAGAVHQSTTACAACWNVGNQ